MSRRDYEQLVKPLGFTANQVCVLAVPGDTRQPCALEFPDGTQECVGAMRELPKGASLPAAWTFVESSGKYFTTI